ASIFTPASRYCAATSQSNGPAPASTTRPSPTTPEVLSRTCAAPADMTPGSVHPGIGNGRSSAPLAMITARVITDRVLRTGVAPCEMLTSCNASSRHLAAHTVASGTYVAPDCL